MSYLPVEPYLIELLHGLSREKIEPIIVGGLGVYLKRRWVQEEIEAGRRDALIAPIPDARATDDIDAFLRLEVLFHPERADFRRVLTECGYVARKEYIQFERPTEDPKRKVILDLLALPVRDPRVKVVNNSRPRRMGERNQKTDPPMLHAYPTPEAFAVEDRVQLIPLHGRGPGGLEVAGEVRVPHPFAALCMKIRAAADHERTPPAEQKARGHKHARDVYLLVAMLSPDEAEECDELRRRYRDHPEFQKLCRERGEFFAASGSPGCVTLTRSVPDAALDRFIGVVSELFGG